jgi:diguanylate cyclase (GGDEF)-like protein
MQTSSYTPNFYTDIPIPYAVFKVQMNPERTAVTETYYVYVNDAYCRMAGLSRDQLIGAAFSESYADPDPQWFLYCFEALRQNGPIHACICSTEISVWLDFTVAPAGAPDHVAFVFTNVDKEKKLTRRTKATDDLIIEISSILNSSGEYDDRINHALAKLGQTIRCDRLYVLETDGVTASNTYEWCAEGVKPEIDTLQHLPYDEYLAGWEPYLEHDTCVIISDIEELKAEDPVDYENLKRQGIKRLIGAPFFDQGKLIGYLGTDNYMETDALNIRAVLESVSYFIGAQVVNHKLVAALDLASRTDAMTGVYNRNALIEQTRTLAVSRLSAGVVFADVNNLKQINDRGGHAAGDTILCQAAELLAEHFGQDNVYRMGGDEFVVLLPLIRRESFHRTRSQFFDLVNRHPDLNMALGFAWTANADNIKATIRLADKRMYDNKVEYYLAHDRRRHHS